jgi:hypothetical protein
MRTDCTYMFRMFLRVTINSLRRVNRLAFVKEMLVFPVRQELILLKLLR